jgi:hypothetical protein
MGLQAGSGVADQAVMRRSVVGCAAAGLVAAAVAAVFGLWLPARHQQAVRAWTSAGERALAKVSLPSPYTVNLYDLGYRVCSNDAEERCYFGPGDPSTQVAAVKAALADLTTGPVRSSCTPVRMPGSPPTCHLSVPVSGSRLAVDIFARVSHSTGPLRQWTYSGGFVLIHLTPR